MMNRSQMKRELIGGKKKQSLKDDTAMDKARGLAEGSPEDTAMDERMGVTEAPTPPSSRKAVLAKSARKVRNR